MRTIVWFRGKDLRLDDHAPLRDAIAAGPVIPLFVVDPYFFAPERAAALPHRIQFLVESLAELAAAIAERGSRLVIVEGKSVDLVPRLAQAWRADRVVAHRWVEPFARERDRRIAAALGDRFVLYEGETLLPPGTLRTKAGRPYAVFTRFARAFAQTAEIAAPLPAPRTLPPVPGDVAAPTAKLPALAALGLARTPRVLAAGEAAGRARLRRFVAAGGAGSRYHLRRDRMDVDGTSRLSADLKFGTVSARRIWTTAIDRLPATARRVFGNELVWREFTHSTLWDRPELLAEPFQPRFAGFPWSRDERAWHAWADGATGYPVVDAAARQLVSEGFVHNRARMIAASFLTKHLLVDYRRGEAHYLRYLTDGDWAQNNANWQWVAGCGCDAQPYFRIFNPVLQGERFDPDGAYVRRYLPALARMPARYIHAPWRAPAAVLAAAGVTRGADYPLPIVDHDRARARYLAVAREHLRG